MPRPRADAGMTLIEVVVAMMVFAIIASGIVAGMTTIARMTSDDRARVIAANLASEQSDLARAIGDPFKLVGATTTRSFPTPNGGSRVFTTTRTVSWVSSAGADVTCGSSANLFFMRVHVLVTWQGRLPSTAPVQTDTLLAPAGHIADPSTGAIAISVVGADGLPVSGVAVSIVPAAGGAAVAAQAPVTNIDGCTYATKVAPGTYSVSITATGYLDVDQDPSPTRSVVVTVGATQSVAFQYDRAATYPVAYAANYVPTAPALAAQLPTDLDTTFITPSGGFYDITAPAGTVRLHPFSPNYSAVAGALGTSSGTTTCAVVDPSAWPAATQAGTPLAAGVRAAPQYGPPGGTAGGFRLPMGVVLVKATAAGYLKAVQTDAGPGVSGEPQCTTKATYVFGNVLAAGTVAIALPFGTWTLYSGTAAAQTTAIAGPALSVPTNLLPGDVTAAGVVTLDPRGAG
ncbi:MAG TPA: prepilin-type N-terminal cleavage/methylation domain-containing protein [Amnibacterium sp.]|nr:prepilin-type N-terminal cleavage/methylation domain-containing protein [Amnibacterium sp.]